MSTIKLVRPIYLDLIASKELEKYLHGKTQNQNESYNNTLWDRVLKNNYVVLEKLRLGVNFNDGRQGSLDIMKNLGIIPGYYTSMSYFNMNQRRKELAWYKSTEQARKTRNIIKAQRKIRNHSMKQNEGKTYKKGGF